MFKAEHKYGLPVAHYRYTWGKTHRYGFKLLVITGLHRSGFLFWVLQVLATSTCETKVLFIYLLTLLIIDYITHFDVLSLGQCGFFSFHKLC